MESGKIKEHFDAFATKYDAIYNKNKSLTDNIIHQLFYKDLLVRYDFVFEALPKLKGKKVLDVGCGSGRYAVEAGVRGAAHVFGIDLSDKMIALANRLALEKKVNNHCKFVQGDFLRFNFPGYYDISFLIGMIEYTINPTAILRRLFRLTTGQLFITFPEKWFWRDVRKKLPLFQPDFPNYFYDEPQILDLMAMAGFEVTRMEKKSHNYLVIAVPRVKQKGAYR